MKYLLFSVLILTATASAEVYKWKDAAGQIHFSDKPNAGQKAEKVNIKNHKNEGSSKSKTVTTATVEKEDKTQPTKLAKQVTMYSTSWCGYCKQAREYFRTNNIPFTDYDIEQNAQAKSAYDAFGGDSVPVIFVNQQRLNGFNSTAFNAIYQ